MQHIVLSAAAIIVLLTAALCVSEKRRRASEKKTLRALEALALSNAELEQFAHVASHDLQEPLRKIVAFSDLLKDNPKFAEGTERDYLERMQSAATRMRRLLDDLLTYARVTTQSHARENVDLDLAWKDVLRDLPIAEKRATVTAEKLPTLRANSLQMKQLLKGLVGNSLKFARKEEPPRVKLCAREAKGFFEFEVEDNGIGFEMKYAEKIFKPFQRLHGRAEYEGTGLGLAICQKIVEQHGGTIAAEGRPGAGSTFRFRLPR